jgi:hypothetical protein
MDGVGWCNKLIKLEKGKTKLLFETFFNYKLSFIEYQIGYTHSNFCCLLCQ